MCSIFHLHKIIDCITEQILVDFLGVHPSANIWFMILISEDRARVQLKEKGAIVFVLIQIKVGCSAGIQRVGNVVYMLIGLN